MDGSSSSCRPSPHERSGYKHFPSKCGEKTGLPLVSCPKCGEEVLELVAGAGSKVPRAVFFKCRLHERDDPSSCPWFLFANSYERMLIRMGLIGATTVQMEQHVTKCLSEAAGMGAEAADRDNVVPLLAQTGGLDAQLKKLVTLGQIGVVCTLVITVFVVLGVIFLLVKTN